MEREREEPIAHQVADRLIGERPSVVFAEALRGLAEGSVLTLGHSHPGKHAGHKKRRGVKGIVEGNSHLCARRQWFDCCRVLIGSIVGDHPKDMILAWLILPVILLRRLSLGRLWSIRQGWRLLAHHSKGTKKKTGSNE